MTVFTWVMVIMLGLDTLIKLAKLSDGPIKPRTRGDVAFDAMCNVALIAWGSVVLARGV